MAAYTVDYSFFEYEKLKILVCSLCGDGEGECRTRIVSHVITILSFLNRPEVFNIRHVRLFPLASGRFPRKNTVRVIKITGRKKERLTAQSL
jgi:hypothetical protein